MRIAAAFLSFCLSTGALAEPPKVVVDVAPIHGIVSAVMKGVGEPVLLIPRGDSPHGASLRPSDARALQGADIVILTSATLTPGLTTRVARIAPDATVLVLDEAPAVTLRPLRNGQGTDPHIWLDAENAGAFPHYIGAQLSTFDPDNGSIYEDNAEQATDAVTEAAGVLETAIARLSGRQIIVLHDSYIYLEERFGLPVAGTIATGHGAAPGASQLSALREMVTSGQVTCVFGEPQLSQSLVAVLTDGTDAQALLVDPFAANVPLGPDYLPGLYRSLAADFAACAG